MIRMTVPEETTDPNTAADVARIRALARSFPSLTDAPGVDPWNPDALDRWAEGGVSDTQFVAARVLLAVWDVRFWGAGRAPFVNLTAAVGSSDHPLDEEHRAAFSEWAKHPWWAW